MAKKAEIIELVGELSSAESKELARCETIIGRGFSTFIEVGLALQKVHDNRLYRSDYPTFADYMEERWNWSRMTGYRQMRGAQLAQLIMSNVTDRLHPTAETQVRPLTVGGLSDSEAIEAWLEAVHLRHSENGHDGEPFPPQERHVRRAVNELLAGRRLAAPAKLAQQGKFSVIYCDPPWQYDYSFSNSRAIEGHYDTMSMAQLFALAPDVRKIAAKDSVMLMWCPPAFTRKAILLLRVWSFSYRTNMVWTKPSIGAGQWVRQQHELLMLGLRGKFPTPEGSMRPASVVADRRGEHSEKPEVFYELIEQMWPNVPRIELFARNRRRGWKSWGNQITE